jgi:hypothetical protein
MQIYKTVHLKFEFGLKDGDKRRFLVFSQSLQSKAEVNSLHINHLESLEFLAAQKCYNIVCSLTAYHFDLISWEILKNLKHSQYTLTDHSSFLDYFGDKCHVNISQALCNCSCNCFIAECLSIAFLCNFMTYISQFFPWTVQLCKNFHVMIYKLVTTVSEYRVQPCIADKNCYIKKV